MSRREFHEEPFGEATLAKLRVFELYAQEWLPVFLSIAKPLYKQIHVFDFFAGPGTDTVGEFGSPLLLLEQLKDYTLKPSWNGVKTTVHFFDIKGAKIEKLNENIDRHALRLDGVQYDIRPSDFEQAFADARPILASKEAAKLVLIDQCGVEKVSPDVFRTLVKSPACDFLFFVSSSFLHRFRDHPAIKQKINVPDDYNYIHREVLEYYRAMLPSGSDYFLSPFSIKKGSNIYGIIFGSAHPLGIDKFLQVAWKQDANNGEANFDISGENVGPGELALFQPTKVTVFQEELERMIRQGLVKNERDVLTQCFARGVTRQHAKPVLSRLKKEKVISLDFQVPNIDNSKSPRPIRLL